ncbi:MAG: enoyl-CoA hydratase-related protein [Quisquiliibacterium sp.]
MMEQSLGNGAVLCSLDARGVATVSLNRPDVNNAYNGDMLDGLHAAMDLVDAQPGIRVVVLRGNGRHFQAGADLAWIAEVGKRGADANLAASRLTGEAVQRLNLLRVPTVALVNGGCFGGGTGVVAACDVVIAAEDAIFAITEARWGLMAGIILPHLCHAIGVRNVRRYALTCERFGAHAAERLGLVHEVCRLDELAARGEQLVDALLMNAPEALALTKRRTLAVSGNDLSAELMDLLISEHAARRQTAEAAEGTASFLQKRHPSWYPGPRD